MFAIISYVLLCIYLSYVISLYNKKNNTCLVSISESYYTLEEEKKGLGILFMIMLMFIVPFSLVVYVLDMTEEKYQIFGVIMLFGIMLVGAAPMFKSHQRIVHYTGAFLCAGFAMIWSYCIGLFYIWWITLFAVMVISLACCAWQYKGVKEWGHGITLWLELVAVVSTYSIIFKNMYQFI